VVTNLSVFSAEGLPCPFISIVIGFPLESLFVDQAFLEDLIVLELPSLIDCPNLPSINVSPSKGVSVRTLSFS